MKPCIKFPAVLAGDPEVHSDIYKVILAEVAAYPAVLEYHHNTLGLNGATVALLEGLHSVIRLL